jgi:hypothetical protein
MAWKRVVPAENIVRWEIEPSDQYDGLSEVVAYSESGDMYYMVVIPAGRVCLRKKSS